MDDNVILASRQSPVDEPPLYDNVILASRQSPVDELPTPNSQLPTPNSQLLPKMTTAILGASNKPERYSHRALLMLRDHDHEVIPVHPNLREIEGIPVTASLSQISGKVDTLTLYLRPELSAPLAPEIIELAPRRVIFNPGTESTELEQHLTAAGIATENACTLVL